MVKLSRNVKVLTSTICAVLVVLQCVMINFPVMADEAKEANHGYSLMATEKGITVNSYFASITGDVFSNESIIYKGDDKLKIDGGLDCKNNVQDNISYADKISSTEIPDYLDKLNNINYGVKCDSITEYCKGEVDLDNNMLVNGDLYIKDSILKGTGYINVTGNINYEPVSANEPYKAFICSQEKDIYINGTNINFNGVLYAPNGTVTIDAKYFSMEGTIIAKEIVFNGTQIIINKGDLSDLLAFNPQIDIDISGSLKENRKITADISTNELCTQVSDAMYKWHMYPVEAENIVYEKDLANIRIDEATSNELTKNFIVTEQGEYLVQVDVIINDNTYSFNKLITVEEDMTPVADFSISATNRDPETGKAKIELCDRSYSPDNDYIASRIWTICFDSNNNGDFNDEVPIVISEGNEEEVSYQTSSVGKYKVELAVTEGFQNTIVDLLEDGSYKTDNTDEKIVDEKIAIVDNETPVATVNVEKEKVVDIVFTVAKTSNETINLYAEKINAVKTKLENEGYTVRVRTAEVNKLTAQDSFAWTEYDHYNVKEPYGTKAKHIIISDNSIKMEGYYTKECRDFLYIDDTNKTQKEFTFSMSRDKRDWHTLDGGGFLFNSTIKNNQVKGYLVLLSSDGYRLYEIPTVRIETFRDGTGFLNIYGKLIKRVNCSNIYAEHNLRIVVDQQSVSLWDGETQIFDNVALPYAYGSGFGPINCNKSHYCDQCSYFKFDNIQMSTVSGLNFSEVIGDYEWLDGAQRYAINLSEDNVFDLNSDEKIASATKSLLEKDINFICIGDDDNKEQYDKVLLSTDGLYLDSSDTEMATDSIYNYIVNSSKQESTQVNDYVSLGTKLVYKNYYYDVENDPIYNAQWKYSYNENGLDEAVNINNFSGAELEGVDQINQFTLPGAYTIALRVQDNPVGDNDNFDSYRKWSQENKYNKLIKVNTIPVCELECSIVAGNDGYIYPTIKGSGYDNDHINDSEKGIVEYKYQYKKLTDSDWTDGIVPDKIEENDIYLQKLVVVDKENQESYPKVVVVKSN